jgi:hypothetical protein
VSQEVVFMTSAKRPARRWLIAATALTAVETVVVSRRRGAFLALDTVVSCRLGHLFTTWWIPALSLKAVRLGWWRFQWCPVGRHWSLVSPALRESLFPDELRVAAQLHDLRLP